MTVFTKQVRPQTESVVEFTDIRVLAFADAEPNPGHLDLVLTALIAKEHVLLVGPPGCAKSLAPPFHPSCTTTFRGPLRPKSRVSFEKTGGRNLESQFFFLRSRHRP